MKPPKPPKSIRKPERNLDLEARRLLKGPEMRIAYEANPNFNRAVQSLVLGIDPVLVVFLLCEALKDQASLSRLREMEAMQNPYGSG